MKQFDTPLLFMVFNRPDTTRVVFEEIKKLKPAFLYISADGPRDHVPTDAQKCKEVREIVTAIDWPCQVKTLFREKNMGCKLAPSSAITWFFEQVPEGIILEDDCVPDPTFFTFCALMLEKYRDTPQVLQIAGNNFQQNNPRYTQDGSYYFSVLPYLWGWASWRRAWKLYDIDIKEWPKAKEQKTLLSVLKPAVYEYWANLWDVYYGGVQNSWDRPWAFVFMLNRGLSINPGVNLISNIGFGAEATHTKNPESELSKMPVKSMVFPLIHPKEIKPNANADAFTFKHQFGIDATFKQHLTGIIRRNLPGLYKKLKKVF